MGVKRAIEANGCGNTSSIGWGRRPADIYVSWHSRASPPSREAGTPVGEIFDESQQEDLDLRGLGGSGGRCITNGSD